MKLTGKELEVMKVLWESKVPLTAAGIIEASENRTWQEKSIYSILKLLIEKKAVTTAHNKPTATKHAKTYTPTISAEKYGVLYLASMGVELDMTALKKEFDNEKLWQLKEE